MSTYVMSDLHGRLDLYLRMLALLEFSPADSLVLLGALTDRNRGGIALFRDVIAMPAVRVAEKRGLDDHGQILLHIRSRRPPLRATGPPGQKGQ